MTARTASSTRVSRVGPPIPGRLYSLDALRGVAALAIVFWHWRHFFFVGLDLPSHFRTEDQPLYGTFWPFYEQGWLAVELFFSLSGFIFFRLYADAIYRRETTPGEFFVRRFSRLYPLHLCTLLCVIAGQLAYVAIHQTSFVYGNNDLRHLVLHLGLVSGIDLDQGFSFNGPVWSVSVEVFLYAMFLVLCRSLRVTALLLFLIAEISFFGIKPYEHFIGRGMGAFFFGGFTFHVFRAIRANRHQASISAAVVVITALLWIAGIRWITREPSAADIFPMRVDLPSVFPGGLLFPATILSFALVETWTGAFWKKLAFLGDISYASYLWGFPLQIAFILIVQSFTPSTAVFQSPWALGLYFAALMLVATLSYRLLEAPAQRFIRRRWLGAGEA